MLELAKWRCKSKCLEEDKEVPASCKDARRPAEEKKKSEEEETKTLSHEEAQKKLAARLAANSSQRTKKHNKKVMAKMAAEATADKELVTKTMLQQAKNALDADKVIQGRANELATEETLQDTKKRVKEGSKLQYESERIARFAAVELADLTAAGDRKSYAEPVAIVLPGVYKEGWGDEGQAVNLWNAFDSKQQHLHTCKFLRKFVEDSGAHAVMMVSPKAKVLHPKLFKSNENAVGCKEGFLVQIEAPEKADRSAWFVEVSEEGAAGTAHQLHDVDSWMMLSNIFGKTEQGQTSNSKGKKAKPKK